MLGLIDGCMLGVMLGKVEACLLGDIEVGGCWVGLLLGPIKGEALGDMLGSPSVEFGVTFVESAVVWLKRVAATARDVILIIMME